MRRCVMRRGETDVVLIEKRNVEASFWNREFLRCLVGGDGDPCRLLIGRHPRVCVFFCLTAMRWCWEGGGCGCTTREAQGG